MLFYDFCSYKINWFKKSVKPVMLPNDKNKNYDLKNKIL